ncbi:maleylpyruvate isomerase family mycothiol-dependent enzyme [Propioniciclava sp.]|uniref:maleylpyruvate isomerase family mycothiol-dependent enzyme n=1 Tax=Propioniciclava sp. TaxID=2038686 RepID=UPI0026153D57|nr:maleylpyruvate isomerase family mycothiol-dependent enzyme [Propioniciclava sp.]
MVAGLARVVAARDRFVELARDLGPDAPTLCAGWVVRDLVAHLLVLQRDPLAWPGVGVPALAGLTERRMAAQVASGFDAALDTLAARSPRFPVMPDDLPGGPMLHHLGEYVVHTEDMARPNHVPGTAADADLADALWARAQRVAAYFGRTRRRGLVLVRTDVAASAAVLLGPETTVVSGAPLELLVWAYRGPAVAGVGVTDAAAIPSP